jgi:uncharacterized membrane protein
MKKRKTNRKKKEKNLLKEIVQPIVPKVKLKDVLQIIIGATILAIPVGFTEETWKLGESLHIINVLVLLVISILFIALFTYYHYHKVADKNYWGEFTKRVIFTYGLSFMIVALLLTLIGKAPWQTDIIVAFSRTAIITLPASMSASLADTLK